MPKLIIRQGGTSRDFPLVKDTVSIGRTPENDIEVNVCRLKKLTNVRAVSAEKLVVLKPPREMTLEMALEYIEDDELVEITPDDIRMRKRLLSEAERRRVNRNARAVAT